MNQGQRLGDPTRERRSSGVGRFPGEAAPVRRASWRVDVSDAVPLPGAFAIAVDVVVPAEAADGGAGGAPRAVLVCLPGGFLSRKYFDLDPGGAEAYSFAEAMARRGFATLAFDHLGVGESSRPEPLEAGYSLGVEAIAAINQRALERALERLARGDRDQGIPPTRCDATIGVGHSMGSVLTVEQQALARPHRGLVLFSFTTRGIPLFLNDDQRSYAGDPQRARREIGALAQRSFGSPYPEQANDSPENRRAAFQVGTAPPRAEELLHGAATNLLGVAGLLSMIPGGYAPAAERIDVPVAILVGDHDLHGTRGLREELPKAPSVEARLVEDCWHCHLVANPRATIARTVADFIDRVLAEPNEPNRADSNRADSNRVDSNRTKESAR